MTRFLITVLNQTGSDQHYLLFASAPRVLEPPAAPTFANIFIAAPVTQHKGNAIFKLTSVPYAVCGEATTNLGSGANVAVCNSYEIKVGNKATGTLGTDIEVILDSEASAEFNTQDVKTTEVVGYSIAAPNYNLPDSRHKFVGYGGEAAPNEILPLATLPMLPDTKFIIEPHLVYTVGTGSFQPGDIIDVDTIGPTISIDFATSASKVTITQGANLEYTIVQ